MDFFYKIISYRANACFLLIAARAVPITIGLKGKCYHR